MYSSFINEPKNVLPPDIEKIYLNISTSDASIHEIDAEPVEDPNCLGCESKNGGNPIQFSIGSWVVEVNNNELSKQDIQILTLWVEAVNTLSKEKDLFYGEAEILSFSRSLSEKIQNLKLSCDTSIVEKRGVKEGEDEHILMKEKELSHLTTFLNQRDTSTTLELSEKNILEGDVRPDITIFNSITSLALSSFSFLKSGLLPKIFI